MVIWLCATGKVLHGWDEDYTLYTVKYCNPNLHCIHSPDPAVLDVYIIIS